MYVGKVEGAPPRKTLKRKSRFEQTREWRKLKAHLDARVLTKEGQYLYFYLTQKELEQYVLHKKTVYRFLVRYLKERGLPYTVTSQTTDGKYEFFIRIPEAPRSRKHA